MITSFFIVRVVYFLGATCDEKPTQVHADDDEQNHYPDSQEHVLCFGKWIVNSHLSLLSKPELACREPTLETRTWATPPKSG
jgi:hypothetical protein